MLKIKISHLKKKLGPIITGALCTNPSGCGQVSKQQNHRQQMHPNVPFDTFVSRVLWEKIAIWGVSPNSPTPKYQGQKRDHYERRRSVREQKTNVPPLRLNTHRPPQPWKTQIVYSGHVWQALNNCPTNVWFNDLETAGYCLSCTPNVATWLQALVVELLDCQANHPRRQPSQRPATGPGTWPATGPAHIMQYWDLQTISL